jgi:hypothetical protein
MSKSLFNRRLIVAGALGLGLFATTPAAQAGKLTGQRTSPAVAAKATPNPVHPKAIRDHRLTCPQLVPKPGSCPRRPYRT